MATNTSSFITIPVLDYSLSTSSTSKSQFLSDLRNALINVGFFYLINAPIAPRVQQDVVDKCKEIFDLPLEKKVEIEMVNSKHFLGYSRLGAEITAREQDYREQFDVRYPTIYIPLQDANDTTSSSPQSYQLQGLMSHSIETFGALTR